MTAPFVHDAACEAELTSHGYTPCQCVIRSAGPELLDALKAAVVELFWLMKQRKVREDGSVARAYTQALAAIARAEGRS